MRFFLSLLDFFFIIIIIVITMIIILHMHIIRSLYLRWSKDYAPKRTILSARIINIMTIREHMVLHVE